MSLKIHPQRQIPIQDLLSWLEPVKLFGGCGPEGLGVFTRGIQNASAFPDKKAGRARGSHGRLQLE
jgi:hypothetical protein